MSQLYDNRHLMIRQVRPQMILRMRSYVTQLFREYFFEKTFTEVHPPCLVQTQCEGGAFAAPSVPLFLARSFIMSMIAGLCWDGDRIDSVQVGVLRRASLSDSVLSAVPGDVLPCRRRCVLHHALVPCRALPFVHLISVSVVACAVCLLCGCCDLNPP